MNSKCCHSFREEEKGLRGNCFHVLWKLCKKVWLCGRGLLFMRCISQSRALLPRRSNIKCSRAAIQGVGIFHCKLTTPVSCDVSDNFYTSVFLLNMSTLNCVNILILHFYLCFYIQFQFRIKVIPVQNWSKRVSFDLLLKM